MKNSSTRYTYRFFQSVFVVLATFLIVLIPHADTQAAWDGEPYSAGETLNPECRPTDVGCTVATSTHPWIVSEGTSDISFTGGNVGIGTTTPGFNLDILGNLNFTGNIYQNGNLYAGDSQWTSTSSDIYFNTGNVGIGTESPLAPLHIAVEELVGGRSFSVLIAPRSEGDTAARIAFNGSRDGVSSRASLVGESGNGRGDFAILTSSNADFESDTADWERRFQVTNTGLVGIGLDGEAPTHTLSVEGKKSGVSLEELSHIVRGNSINTVLLDDQNDILFFSDLTTILVYDASNPNELQYISEFLFEAPIASVKKVLNFLYVATGDEIVVFDVNDTDISGGPLYVYSADADIRDMYPNGDYIYVVDGQDSFYVVSSSDLQNMQKVSEGTVETAFSTSDYFAHARIDVDGSYAYVVAGPGLQIFDISNPVSPVSVATYRPSQNSSLYGDIKKADDRLYITASTDGSIDSFIVLDVSDPTDPYKIGGADIGGEVIYTGITIDSYNEIAYVTDGGYGIYAIDINFNDETPRILSYQSFNGAPRVTELDSNGYLYVGQHDRGGETGGLYTYSTKTKNISASFTNGNVGIGIEDPEYALSVVGTHNYTLTVGNNLVKNGYFDGGDDWDYDMDWDYTGGTMRHFFTSSPSSLEQWLITQTDETYKVSFSMSERTKGYVKVSLGGNTLDTEFTEGNSNVYIVSDGQPYMSFIPSPDFDGRIDNVTVYLAKQIDPSLVLYAWEGLPGMEFRVQETEGRLDNTFIGNETGAFNSQNAFLVNAFGAYAATYNSGSLVTAIGAGAALNNSGWFVNAIGTEALKVNEGARVDALGYGALADKKGGDTVVGIGADDSGLGFFRGTQKDIEESVLIGPSSVTYVDSNATSSILTNVFAFGGRVTDSNQLVLGNRDTREAFVFGNVGLGTSTPQTKLAVEGGHSVTITKQSAYQKAEVSFADVVVTGNIAYTAERSQGMSILDVSEKNNPRLISTLPADNYMNYVLADGNRLFVNDGQTVKMYNVTDPRNAILEYTQPISQYIRDIAVYNDMLYVANDYQVSVFYIDREQGVLVSMGDINFDYYTSSLNTYDDTLFVSDNNSVFAYDISSVIYDDQSEYQPLPISIAVYDTGEQELHPQSITVSNNIAYVVYDDLTLTTFDVSDRSQFKKLDSMRLTDGIDYNFAIDVKVVGNYVYIADGEPDSVYIAYVADPRNIELAGYYATGGSSTGIDVDVDGNVFVASDHKGLVILKAEQNLDAVLATFTAGNVGIGTHAPEARLHVAGLGGNDGLKFISAFEYGGGYTPAAVQGNYLYANNWGGGFDIIDISSPYRPERISGFSSELYAPVVSGDFAYARNSNNEISVFYINDPKNIIEINTITGDSSLAGNPQIHGNYLYSLDTAGHIEVFNIADSENETYEGSVSAEIGNFNQETLYIFGSYLFAVNTDDMVEIYDISINPADPFYKGAYEIQSGEFESLTVEGDMLYVGVYGNSANLVEIVDISNVTSPLRVSFYTSKTSQLSKIKAQGTFIYGIDNNDQIEIVDVSDSYRPQYVDTYTSSRDYFESFIISGNYIYAQNDDSQIETVDISNPKAPISALFTGGRIGVGTLDPKAALSVVGSGGDALNLLSSITSPVGLTNSKDVQGEYLYIINGMDQLEIYNISDAARPILMSTYVTESGYVSNPIVSGAYAYVYNNMAGHVEKIDISSSTQPVFVSNIATNVGAFYAKNGYVYSLNNFSGVLEVSDEGGIVGSLSTIYDFPYSFNPVISGNYLYTGGASSDEIVVIDISDHQTMSIVSSFTTDQGGVVISSISVEGEYLYVKTSAGKIEIFNIANPESPSYDATLTSPSGSLSLDTYNAIENGYLYTADGSCNIHIFDAENPLSPNKKDAYFSEENGYCANNVSVENGKAYVVANDASLKIYNISGMNNPAFAATFSGGRVGIGSSNPLAMLDVAGSMILSGSGRYINFGYGTGDYGYGIRDNDGVIEYKNSASDQWMSLSEKYTKNATVERSLSPVIGDSIFIGQFSLENGTGVISMNVVVPTVAYIVSKTYVIPVRYNQTGGDWMQVLPVSSSGDDTSNNFSLDISVVNGVANLRLRTIATDGYTYGNALVTMRSDGSQYQSFSPMDNIQNESTIDGILESTMVTTSGGLVGIGVSLDEFIPFDFRLFVDGGILAIGNVCTLFGPCLSDIEQPSDARFKQNITGLETDTASSTVLSNIMKLNPVTYTWNETYLGMYPHAKDATSTKLGFIAQEVQAIYPEAIMHLKDGYLGVDYGKLTAVLTAGMQEMVRITGVFKDNLIGWFADSANGIDKLFSNEVYTKKICVAKSDGTEICITGDELEKIANTPATSTVNTLPQTAPTNPAGNEVIESADSESAGADESANTPSEPSGDDSESEIPTQADSASTNSGVEYQSDTDQNPTENNTQGETSESTLGAGGNNIAQDAPASSDSVGSDSGSSNSTN